MDAFETLYQKYKLDVYYYLLSLTKDPTLAEDLVSETFLLAYRSLHKLQEDSNFKAWILRIARNQFLSYCRNKKIMVPYEEYMDILQCKDNDMQKTISYIKELVSRKDERTQRLFQLRLDGYSYAEISELLHLRESSCRVMEFRLKKWIKEEMEKEESCYDKTTL